MSLLETILQPGGLSVLFQPIVDLREERPRLWGVEALVRGPVGSNLERADILFEYVRRKRAEIVVDRACVTAILDAAMTLPASLDFAINVHAVTLSRDPEFLGFLTDAAEARAIPLSRLTVEIVEHAPEWADLGLAEGLDALRHMGIRIALDDVGLGQSNYRMMLDCKPDYFKIDRHFVKDSHRDFYRQAVLESVAQLARRFGARVIAEGIEDAADRDTVQSAGIELGQGYLFSAALTTPGLASSELGKETRAVWDTAEAGRQPRPWVRTECWGEV